MVKSRASAEKEDGDDENGSSQISRIHVIEESNSGLISLMGGKWTIYRLMGEEVIDAVVS